MQRSRQRQRASSIALSIVLSIASSATAAVIAIAASSTASAWFDSGHMQIAAIVYERLSPARRGAVDSLLREHPRFAEDFQAALPIELRGARRSDVDRWIFAHASTWPDVARRFEAALKERYHRSRWHYISYPVLLELEGPLTLVDLDALESADRARLADGLKLQNTARSAVPGGDPQRLNAVQALHRNVAILNARDRSAPERAVALCWLLHIGGDLHQPLHGVSLYSRIRLPQGDRGGTRIAVAGGGSLHQQWDGMLGDDEGAAFVQARARELLADERLVARANTSARVLDYAEWARESTALASKHVYTAEVLRAVRALDDAGERSAEIAVSLPPGYLEEGREIARRRAVEAGFRLARIVEQLQGFE
jgi:hypothetical protein